jgi:hypothetical protein
VKASESQLRSNLAIRGPFINETFRGLAEWNFSLSASQNFALMSKSNSIGASSQSWLAKFVQETKRRFDFSGVDRSLVELVKEGWSLEDWRPILLWHMYRRDELLRAFLVDWLFEKYEQGIVVISADPVVEFLHELVKACLGSEDAWKEVTYRRVANGLLKIATDCHLMRGRVNKEFESYRLPEKSFIYLLHALMQREQSTRKVIDALDWRIFMMKSSDVEEELLRLHQYGALRFERAGSFLELTLPDEDANKFVRSEP